MSDPEPKFTNEDRNGRLRTTIKARPGERLKLCRCMQSADMPYCDSAHKFVETSAGPIIVLIEEAQEPPAPDQE
jgi:CDGSH-type Zn-finger protein